jgi:lysophospholipase L1-like esterase
MARAFLQRAAMIIAGAATIVLLLELATRAAIGLHLVQYDPPMLTMLPRGTADWRDAHVTADDLREPDPVLWWRPKKAPPYTEQGFKGPVVRMPKPRDTIRIITYGDSNTEGTVQSSWPDRLQAHLNVLSSTTRIHYEVLNAGVAGYSSYQGLLRFRQEAQAYQPDLVLVSFGWNDLASADESDNSYRPPHPVMVKVERGFLRLKSFLVATYYARNWSHRRPENLTARVSKRDYVGNMKQFQEICKTENCNVILLTRPHRESADQLRAMRGFRSHVPTYNEALLKRIDGYVLDVQGAFNSNKDVFADECHFNTKGQDAMASYLVDNLRRLNLL